MNRHLFAGKERQKKLAAETGTSTALRKCDLTPYPSCANMKSIQTAVRTQMTLQNKITKSAVRGIRCES